MMTKKDMVSKIVEIYGKGSKMAVWFAIIAINGDYIRTRKIYKKIMEKNVDK